MARNSRRDDMLAVALAYFVERGYEGTSIGALAAELSVSKAAISYHFPSKDDLLGALATPLLDALDDVVPGAEEPPPSWPEGVQALMARYLDVLLDHRDVAVWLEGDRAILRTWVGDRLRDNHRRMRAALLGGPPARRSRVAASMALGTLWRPVRHLDPEDVSAHRDLVVQACLAPLREVR